MRRQLTEPGPEEAEVVRRYALRDDLWRPVKDLLSGHKGYAGVMAKDNRLFVVAVS